MEFISGYYMMLSVHFGRFFWIDDDFEFCSCPAFVDGTADLDTWDYVSEWTDLEGVDLDKLFTIHRHLVLHTEGVPVGSA